MGPARRSALAGRATHRARLLEIGCALGRCRLDVCEDSHRDHAVLVIADTVGAMLGELSSRRDIRRAAHVGTAAWIGFLIGTAVKVALAFSMIAIFLVALFWV